MVNELTDGHEDEGVDVVRVVAVPVDGGAHEARARQQGPGCSQTRESDACKMAAALINVLFKNRFYTCVRNHFRSADTT